MSFNEICMPMITQQKADQTAEREEHQKQREGQANQMYMQKLFMQTMIRMMIQTMSAAPAGSFGTPAMMPTIPTTDEVKNNTQEEAEAEENEE